MILSQLQYKIRMEYFNQGFRRRIADSWDMWFCAPPSFLGIPCGSDGYTSSFALPFRCLVSVNRSGILHSLLHMADLQPQLLRKGPCDP